MLLLGAASTAAAAFLIAVCTYRHEVRVTDIALVELGGHQAGPRLVGEQSSVAVRDALQWDFVLIAGYAVTLAIGLALAWSLVSSSARRWIGFGFFVASVTVLADCGENVLLLRAVGAHPTLLGVNCYDAASAFAVVKFCAGVPAAALALLGLGLAVTRSLTFPHRTLLQPSQGRRPLPILHTDSAEPARAADAGQQARWRRAYAVPECGHPKHRRPVVRRPAVRGLHRTGSLPGRRGGGRHGHGHHAVGHPAGARCQPGPAAARGTPAGRPPSTGPAPGARHVMGRRTHAQPSRVTASHADTPPNTSPVTPRTTGSTPRQTKAGR